MFILFGFLFYLSSVLEDKYEFNGVMKGLLLAIPLFALALASFITGKKIGDHLKLMKWIIFFGILISGASTIAIIFFKHYVALLIIFFICGAGIGMTLPCLDALITESIDKSIRGAITSIYSAMRFTGVAVGPLVIAFLMDFKVWTIALLFICLAAIAAYFAFRNINPEDTTSPS